MIGTNTVECIQSGAGLRHRRRWSTASCGGSAPRSARRPTVATGGLAPVVIPHCRTIQHHEPWLTLEGLRLVHERNAGGRPMAEDPQDAERTPTGREAEVLAARRASLERLGRDRAFALNLRSVLGVDEPTSIGAIRAAHARSRPRHDDRRRAHVVAGRVVLQARYGQAGLRDDPRSRRRPPAGVRRGDLDPRRVRASCDELDLGDIVGAEGTVGTTRKGELSLFVERWAMLTKALPPSPREVARPAGPRSPAAAPLPAPDHGRDAAAARRSRAPRCCGRCAASSTSAASSSSRGRSCRRSPAARTRARSPRTTTRSTSR